MRIDTTAQGLLSPSVVVTTICSSCSDEETQRVIRINQWLPVFLSAWSISLLVASNISDIDRRVVLQLCNDWISIHSQHSTALVIMKFFLLELSLLSSTHCTSRVDWHLGVTISQQLTFSAKTTAVPIVKLKQCFSLAANENTRLKFRSQPWMLLFSGKNWFKLELRNELNRWEFVLQTFFSKLLTTYGSPALNF